MEERLKEEIEAVARAFMYSYYESFHKFVEQLRGYEKLTGYRFKMGKYTKMSKLETDVEKALVYNVITLVCDHNIITGCDASMEIGRHGDELAFFKILKYHNHEPDADKSHTTYFKMEDPNSQQSSCTLENFPQQLPFNLEDCIRNGQYYRKIYSYPSVQRRLLYIRCTTRCCKSHYLGIENSKGFYLLRSSEYHNHDSTEDDEDSDDELKLIDTLPIYKTCFYKALAIVARGLTATTEREVLEALNDAEKHFKKFMKRL